MKGKKVYIVGIGGIGNSALAQLFKHEGASVSGSDRVESPTTKMLEAAGIKVCLGHNPTQIAEDTDALVYSDAIVEGSDGYAERLHARELGIPELSYFEALGKMSEGKKVMAVAGTNGKTTTTAMLGKILVDAGEDPTIVVGSIAADFHSNFRPGSSDLFVVEADEFKRHFLSLRPHTLVITNIELDHTDYYKNLDDVISAFNTFARVVDAAGDIVTDSKSEPVSRALQGVEARVVDYTKEDVPELLLPGEFNRDNARAAKAAVHALAPHIKDEVIDASLSSFRGTWRRFEYKGLLPQGAQLYDDYAHHPTAIEKTVAAAREKFASNSDAKIEAKKIVIFFHPHLYSRTRDLFDDFARALATADEVFILPVYAAREVHDPSVSNAALAKAVNDNGGNAAPIETFEAVTLKLQELGSDVVAFTMGAGDVYRAGEDALK
jgi:UDP-N-acetylmuramate--alanine ligase